MSTTAGWYPDPDAPGMYRWWDGENWVNMQVPKDLVPQEPSTSEKVTTVLSVLPGIIMSSMFLIFVAFVVWAVWLS